MGISARTAEIAPQVVRVRGPESNRRRSPALIVVSIQERQNDLRGDYEPTLVDANELRLIGWKASKSVTVNVPIANGWIPRHPESAWSGNQRLATTSRRFWKSIPRFSRYMGDRMSSLPATTLQTEPINYEGITQTLQTIVRYVSRQGASSRRNRP